VLRAGDHGPLLEARAGATLDLIAEGPYVLGERFSAADVLWGVALDWITRFGLLERTPALGAYLDRVTTRPAFQRVAETTAEIEAARAGRG